MWQARKRLNPIWWPLCCLQRNRERRAAEISVWLSTVPSLLLSPWPPVQQPDVTLVWRLLGLVWAEGAPLTSIQLSSCGENVCVLLNLLQSNTAWLSRGSVIQHSRSGRRSPWTPSASSWGAPPYVPSPVPLAAGTEFTHSGFIIYLFVCLFITQARWLRLSPHRKRV